MFEIIEKCDKGLVKRIVKKDLNLNNLSIIMIHMNLLNTFKVLNKINWRVF